MSSADADAKPDAEDQLSPEEIESFVNLMNGRPSCTAKVKVSRVRMGKDGFPVNVKKDEDEAAAEEDADSDGSTSTSEDQPTKPGPSAAAGSSDGCDVSPEVIEAYLKASTEGMKADTEARKHVYQRPESIPSVYDNAAFTYCKAICKKITDYCDDDDVEAYDEEIDGLFQKLGRFVQDRHAAKHVRLQAEYDTMMRRKCAEYINQCTRCTGTLTKALINTDEKYQDRSKAISDAITALATSTTAAMNIDGAN